MSTRKTSLSIDIEANKNKNSFIVIKKPYKTIVRDLNFANKFWNITHWNLKIFLGISPNDEKAKTLKIIFKNLKKQTRLKIVIK